ncbi:MAG: hypothetical protein ACD_75C00389G0002 [uncultured bacterium]|nr:MAG: hypothetical protein ACD_75C00389G0002 [uncultured bacterium]
MMLEVPIMKNDKIISLIEQSGRKLKPDMTIYRDTSAFMDLEPGDVIVLEDTPFLINRNERESDCGMDDDPKYWVKRTTNLETGEIKIVKLVFFEELWQKMGDFNVRFFRSPEKEAEILDLVRTRSPFMQGKWTKDVVGNNVRVIDFIPGPSLMQMISRLDMSHKDYFHKELPHILSRLIRCLEALTLLHDHNLVHGDVHWNHILWDREIEQFRWIDFDYAYNFPENPFGADVFGVGRILASVIGQGPILFHDIKNNPDFRQVIDNLVQEDFAIISGNQLMNLKKVYPYLPDGLNNILLHFSGHTEIFYESVGEIAHDLRKVLDEI